MEPVTPGPRVVIVAYKPRPGFEARLRELTESHVPLLRKLGFATNTRATAMQAADGTIVEVFEWAEGGMAAAHQHPLVKEMWFQYAEACTYVPLNTLAESEKMFADFTPLGLF